MASHAVAIVHRDAILERLASGKRLDQIAPEYGVTPQAISKYLKSDPDYLPALEQSYERRIDAAEQAILDASEQVDVSRARAYHDAIRWRAGVDCAKFRELRQPAPVQIAVIVQGKLDQSAQSLLGALQQDAIAPDTYFSNDINELQDK